MIEAQGGDPRVVAEPSRLVVADVVTEILAPSAGYVTRVDALDMGLSAVALGAGRTRADQAVDPAVGIELCAPRGAKVGRGDVLAKILSRSAEDGAKIRDRVLSAFAIEDAPIAPPPLVLERIGA
jgi:pyrimidine-nucleoside phosphorylase